MSIPEIEEFAKILIQDIRDEAVQNCDMQLKSACKSPVAMRWRKLMADENVSDEFVRQIIPDIVDKTITSLLLALDQEILRILFLGSNGRMVDISKEGLGELTGWYIGSDGWRDMYSKERFVDYFADFDLSFIDKYKKEP